MFIVLMNNLVLSSPEVRDGNDGWMESEMHGEGQITSSQGQAAQAGIRQRSIGQWLP